jgi:dTDP-4-dehydrorhamnose reductase
MTKVAILGSTGMLGSTLVQYLSPNVDEIVEINRSGIGVNARNRVLIFDAISGASLEDSLQGERFDFIINCIGVIKQLLNEEIDEDVKNAFVINSHFPGLLNEFSLKFSTPVIQIGTDCVYSGQTGNYSETSEFDCSDVYGKSKLEGELRSSAIMTIRSSIIGHEMNSAISLMDWFLKLPLNSEVNGFVNHIWNGVTTLDFARIALGVMNSDSFLPGVSHLVPADQVSKYELLNLLSDNFDRADIHIEALSTTPAINRTLSTIYPERNSNLWSNAGYNRIPTISEMTSNYADWSSR